MSIPCKMRPTGLDSLPMGYTRIDFLEANNMQYIDTGVMPTGDMNIKVDVMATKWVYVNYVFGSVQRSNANIVLSMNYNSGHSSAGMYRYGTQSSFLHGVSTALIQNIITSAIETLSTETESWLHS